MITAELVKDTAVFCESLDVGVPCEGMYDVVKFDAGQDMDDDAGMAGERDGEGLRWGGYGVEDVSEHEGEGEGGGGNETEKEAAHECESEVGS